MTDLLAPPIPDVRTAHTARPIGRLGLSLNDRVVALPVLGAMAAILYVVNLTVSGYANTYYSMAAQAGSQSWSALFFGALDSQAFITIDKPPLATWLMSLSVKILGLSSFAILLPEALLGVGTVMVLYLAVRRSFGPTAGLLAGLVMAVTPVSVLIFRYDNPDALLTFLLVSGAWALGRGLEQGRLRWALLAAILVGAGFLTKYLQAYLVLPAFALVWLVSAPVSIRRRLGGLAASVLTVAVASGWWVAIVELLPAASRPFIGGSTSNSVHDLVLGYDGLGRIFGNNPGGSGLSSALDGLAGSGGPGPGGPSFGGVPGLLRPFNDQFGGQIAWLLPASLLSFGSAVALYRRKPRTDRRLAGYLLWGTWLGVHVAVFSFMSGIIHSYYTVIIAPAIAALVGAGAVDLWARRRTNSVAGLVLAAGVLVTGAVAWLLLDRTPSFAPGLGVGILAVSVGAAIAIAIPAELIHRRAAGVAVAAALVAVTAGPFSYAMATMATAYGGGDPGAGPQAASAFGGGGVGGGLGAGPAVDQALVDYLVANRGSARWIVAANGSQVAAVIELAAQLPVMTMGGYTGSDPTPTLDQLKAYVASGELRYVLIGDRRGGPGFGGPSRGFGGAGAVGADASARTAWVLSACTQASIGGTTNGGLFDCATAVSRNSHPSTV